MSNDEGDDEQEHLDEGNVNTTAVVGIYIRVYLILDEFSLGRAKNHHSDLGGIRTRQTSYTHKNYQLVAMLIKSGCNNIVLHL